MAQWVRLCGVAEAPAEGNVMEAETQGVAICLARVGGELAALDNWCPHRRGPLGQGWVEGNAVVCPWHSWTFDLKSGEAEYPVSERVAVFPVRVEGDDVLVDVSAAAAAPAGELNLHQSGSNELI
jgi:nitrite reductase (NADH) small subunit